MEKRLVGGEHRSAKEMTEEIERATNLELLRQEGNEPLGSEQLGFERLGSGQQGDYEPGQVGDAEQMDRESARALGDVALGDMAGERRAIFSDPGDGAGMSGANDLSDLNDQDEEMPSEGMGGLRPEDLEFTQEEAETEAKIRAMVAKDNGYPENTREDASSMAGMESKKQVAEHENEQRTAQLQEDGQGNKEDLWQGELMTKNQAKLTVATVAKIDQLIKDGTLKPADMEHQWFLGVTAMLRGYGRKLGDGN